MTKEWGVVSKCCSNGCCEEHHVIPFDDESPHTLTPQCWCEPLRDDEDDTIIVHNSADGREAYEGRIPSFSVH